MDISADHSLAHASGLWARDDTLNRLLAAQERTAVAVERLVELLAKDGGDVVAAPRRRSSGKASRTVMTRSWLRMTLRENGPMSWARIVVAADAAPGGGFSEKTLRRVRDDIAVVERTGGQVLWRLKEVE